MDKIIHVTSNIKVKEYKGVQPKSYTKRFKWLFGMLFKRTVRLNKGLIFAQDKERKK